MQNFFSKNLINYLMKSQEALYNRVLSINRFHLFVGFLALGYTLLILFLMYLAYDNYLQEQEQVRSNLVVIVESLKDFHESHEKACNTLKQIEIDLEKLKLLNDNSSYFYYVLGSAILLVIVASVTYYLLVKCQGYNSIDLSQAAQTTQNVMETTSSVDTTAGNTADVVTNEVKDLLGALVSQVEKETQAIELLQSKIPENLDLNSLANMVSQNKTACEKLTSLGDTLATKEQVGQILDQMAGIATEIGGVNTRITNLEYEITNTISMAMEETGRQCGVSLDLSNAVTVAPPVQNTPGK